MGSTYYLGKSPEDILGDSPQFFYGIRRNDDGELYFVRNNQLRDTEPVMLNNPEAMGETYDELEAGVDFFEGVDENHDIVYAGLRYPQYKWDNRSIFYYVDADGFLVMRINRGFTYPDGTSSNS